MSTLRLVHRAKGTTSPPIDVPDGQHDWAILIDNCAHCGQVYNVDKTTDRFCSKACEAEHYNKARRKHPPRPYKKRVS
jgi:hypothetical protein